MIRNIFKFLQKNKHYLTFGGMLVVLILVAFWPSTAHAGVPLGAQLAPPGGTPILLPDGTYGDTGHSYKLLYNGWRLLLGIANILVSLYLLALAFLSISHVEYDKYQIKKSLPNLIIGIILANFSFLICRMFISSADVLTFTFTQGDQTGLLFTLAQDLGLWQIGAGGMVLGILALFTPLAGVGIIVLILGLLLVLAPFIALLVLWFVLWFRVAALYLLIVIAPVAFVCLGFQPTYSVFKEWWCQFLKYTYMYPVVFLVLWLSKEINMGASQGGGGDISLALWAVTLALCWGAITLPFSFGGPCKYANFMPSLGAKLGQLGKFLGKQGWNFVQSMGERGFRGRGGWSPRSAYGAAARNWQEGANRARETTEAGLRGGGILGLLGIGSRDRANSYNDVARRTQANSRLNERLGGDSPTEFQNLFREMLLGGAHPDDVQALLTRAQSTGRMQDVLAGVAESPDMQNRLIQMAGRNGVDLTPDDLSAANIQDNGVRSKIFRSILGTDQEGLKKTNELQEAAEAGGNYTAVDVVQDQSNGQYRAVDRTTEAGLNELTTEWLDRFKRIEARATLPNFRPEAIYNPAIFRQLVKRGMFSPNLLEHFDRANEATLEAMASSENMAVLNELEQAGGTGAVNAKNLKDALRLRKQITSSSALAPNEVVVNVSGGGGATTPQVIRIDMLKGNTPGVDMSKIESQIMERVNQYTAQTMQTLQAQIASSTAFSTGFKDQFTSHADWEGLRANFQKISARSYQAAEAEAAFRINGLVEKINTDLGKALESGVDVPAKIESMIQSVPAIKQSSSDTSDLREEARQKVREAFKTSTSEVIHQQAGGTSKALTAQDILSVFEGLKASADPTNTNINLPDKLKDAAGHELNPDELVEVHRLIEAYLK